MECEIRFYYPIDDKGKLINKLGNVSSLTYKGEYYEKTIQYNSTLENNNFYSKEIDGRFRIRITEGKNIKKCLLSWKKRLPNTLLGKVNKEEEIEVNIDYNDYKNFIYVIENIVKLERKESYERYRNIFFNEEVEIVVDEYPFAVALEIEAKTNEEEEKIIDKYINILNLKYEDSYRLSWDDKYSELCKLQNIRQESDVLFEKTNMPKLENI